MKQLLLLCILLGAVSFLMAQEQPTPTDEQLVINALRSQNELQARIIQNLQKEVAKCKPEEKGK
jgi:hypothetical protein